MKLYAKSLALAACLLLPALASAANPNNYSVGSLETSDNFNHQVGKPEFSDLLHFTLKSGSTYDLVFDFAATSGFGKNSRFDAELFYGDLRSNSDLNSATLVSGSTPGSFVDSLLATGLAEGSYTLHMFGLGHSQSAKYEIASIGITSSPVAAVPEPETYAMLIAGLGLMGFIARRRSKQAA